MKQSVCQWHALAHEDVIKELGADPSRGLSDSEAVERLSEYGRNQLTKTIKVSPVTLFFKQFKNPLIIILLISTVLSGIMGHAVESIAIGVIIFFAVFLGFIQEFRADKALDALCLMAAPEAWVIRSGRELHIPSRDVVPGDLIILSSGSKIPADAYLIEAVNLKTDEASLTGESLPATKKSGEKYPDNTPPGDRKNIVFAGTTVIYGRGCAIVVATGMKTEFGKIAGMLQNVKKENTPLEKNLDHLAKILAIAAFSIVAVIVLLGLLRGQPFIEMFVFGIALAVAVVPEALPAVVTITLAIGVQRMVRRNALIRRLPAVETLGCTTFICSDKTGTLTKDEMTVNKILIGSKIMLEITGSGYDAAGEFLQNDVSYPMTDDLMLMIRAAVLSSDARIEITGSGREMIGDPTEGALIVVAEKAGIRKEVLVQEFPRIAEIPFSSETKRMVTLHKSPDGNVAFAKGAAEIILASCGRVVSGGGITPLSREDKTSILTVAKKFGEQALRVLGVAYAPAESLESFPEDMIFLGLFAMSDPPRPEAAAAIKRCRDSGIKVMMITGDHPVTAKAIAGKLDLIKNADTAVTGAELSAMSDKELEDRIENISVCARVSPEHKLRIVGALQRRGHVVAMTGDGVNDAPAIKKADIGIAMGITGTDVSREASAMILTDDNFASIVAAVEEGRIIFENIKKFLGYLLSSNIGEILLMAGAAFSGLPMPLSAVQILYVNLATDGLPALALAVDPPELDIMERPPRKKATQIFSRHLITLMAVSGIWSAIVNMGLFIWALKSGRPQTECMSITFTSLVLIQFFNAYNFRSETHSALNRPFANKWLNAAILWEIFLLVIIIYVPFLQKPFKTYSLTSMDWLILLVGAFSIIPVIEISKKIQRIRSKV